MPSPLNAGGALVSSRVPSGRSSLSRSWSSSPPELAPATLAFDFVSPCSADPFTVAELAVDADATTDLESDGPPAWVLVVTDDFDGLQRTSTVARSLLSHFVTPGHARPAGGEGDEQAGAQTGKEYGSLFGQSRRSSRPGPGRWRELSSPGSEV